MRVIIEYKSYLNKDDLVKVFDLSENSKDYQRHQSSKIMKAVKEFYKKETGTAWEDTFVYRNVNQNVIPTEYFLKCCPEARKSFRRS